MSAALTYVTVTAHHGDLARDHHVGGALDAVDKRFAAAVEVVELALCHRVVDVDGGNLEFAFGGHLIEAMHAGGRFFAHTLDVSQALGVPVRIFLQVSADGGKEHFFFFAFRLVEHG